MTGLEALVAKELVEWGAKFLFNIVQDQGNDLSAEAAKKFSKEAMSQLGEEAQKAIKHHLPKGLKL
jgi:hypothetical protein